MPRARGRWEYLIDEVASRLNDGDLTLETSEPDRRRLLMPQDVQHIVSTNVDASAKLLGRVNVERILETA